MVRKHTILIAGIVLLGCETVPAFREDTRPRPIPVVEESPRNAPDGYRIAAAAIALSEASHRGNTIRVGDRTFPLDCSGAILAAHYKAGMDLIPTFSAETGNGVARLWRMGTPGGEPSIGEVIFWDNTYDRNRNGLWDDELTHAGIVVAKDRDGTISYVHHNYRRGIVVETMNLGSPDSDDLNSPMRMRGQRGVHRNKWLASHLYRDTRRIKW